jgi:hypothetical protein
MKYVAAVIFLFAAFAIGRFSVARDVCPLPSLPIAYVHATQPIAITVNVDLTTKNAANTSMHGVHQLKGRAHYRFTNLTDKVVSIAFPPTRVIGMSSRYVGGDSMPCPPALATKETVEIPAQSSITRSGEWSATVVGDFDEFLQGGVRNAYTFSPTSSDQSFAGTLIAFQVFDGVKPKNQFYTTAGHLELVSPSRTP